MYDVVFCYRKGGSESKISGLADVNPLSGGLKQGVMSAMCDSVSFIRPCHRTGDSDLGGLCPVTGYMRALCANFKNNFS